MNLTPRSLLRGRILLLSFALFTAVLGVPLVAQSDRTLADPQSLGLLVPTEEELQRLRVLAPRVERVLPNAAALELANAERLELGLAPLALPVVPDGSELVYAATDVPTRATAAAGAPPADPQSPSTAQSAIPSAADNSTTKYFPPIRSQGQIGSCATFAAGYTMAGYMWAKARGLDVRNERNDDKLSPKFIYNFVNGGVNNGSWYTEIFELLLRHGAPTWEAWPYTGDKAEPRNYLEWPTTPAVYRNAIGNRFESAYTVTGIDTPAGLQNLKTTLANGAVVVFAANVFGFQYATVGDDPATPSDNSFVGRPVVSAARVDASGHAMAFVGYDDNLWVDLNRNGQVDTGEKGALRIANSWDKEWKDGGFVWMSYDALRVVSAVAGVGPDVSQYRAGGGIAPPTSSGGSDGPVSGGAANPLLKPVWNSTVYGIIARASYTPQLLAEFTITGVKARNEISILLARGAATATVPDAIFRPGALIRQGGFFGFGGTNAAVNATFIFDFSDLRETGDRRYFLRMEDHAPADSATVSSFRLLDGQGNPVATSATNVPFTVDNSVGIAYHTLSVSNTAPSITSPLIARGTVGVDFTHVITANGGPSSFTAANLPSGLTLNTATGAITGAPLSPGDYSIPIGAVNSNGTDNRTLAVTIAPAITPPTINSAASVGGTQGSPFSYQITATNVPTSFGLNGTLPNGVTLNLATGLISGTPAQAGAFNVQILARNGGGTGARALVITIAAPLVLVPAITSASTATIGAGDLFSYRIQAANSPTSFGALNLPTGLILNAANGTITGRVALARPYVITLTAINAAGTGYSTLNLSVTGNSSFGPSNDAFGSAIALSGTAPTTTGSNVNATAETSEPEHAGAPANNSVWWSWTAPSSGTLTLSTAGSTPAVRSALYTGTSVSTLTAVARSPANSNAFAVVAGTSYRLAVDSIDNQDGSIALALSLAAPAPARPANDNFAAATVLSGTATTAATLTTAATAEAGEPAHGDTPATKTVWYKWTAPAAGRCLVSLGNSNFDTLLSIYTGTALNALSVVVRDDDSGPNSTSEAGFTARAGTTYNFAIDGYDGDSGELKLSVAFTAGAAGPANDNFAAAPTATGPTAYTVGSSANATRETGEPAHANLPAARSVWFRWIAPSSGPVTLSTAGSTFNTVLAVYTGSTLAGLKPIASNDNAGTDFTSRLTFVATSGTTYSIAIDGYDGAAGDYTLRLTLADNNTNNAFADAATLANGVRTTALNTAATAETGEPAHYTGNSASKSLWWRWTPSTTGFVAISTAGSTFDTVLAVYTGSTLATLVKAAANNDANFDDSTSNIFFRAIAGRTYFIAVDGFGGTSGTISLIVTPSADPNTVYATNFESFTAGAGQLTKQDQWEDFYAPASGGAQGILARAFADQGRAGYLGFGSPAFGTSTGNQVRVYRPLDFDPVAEGAPIVQVRADIAIIPSSNGRNDAFRLSLYTTEGRLLGGFYFDTANRNIATSDGAVLTSRGSFTPNTRYMLLGTFNFATRRWTARINSTELVTDSPFGTGATSFDIGDFSFLWRIADAQRQPGNNYIIFDNLAITAHAMPATAPAIQLPAVPTTASLGSPLSFAITANGPITAYAASGLPAGLTLNTITGLVSGTPTQAGTFTANFTATNASGRGPTSSLTFTIAAGPPVINNASEVTAALNKPFSFQLTATNAPQVFGLQGTAALPSGLTLNPTTGLIAGTPRSLGNYRLTVAAQNAAGSGTATLDLKVDAAPRLSNLSVRTALDANQIVIVGVTMSGGAKNVLLRAAGPTLSAFGVPSVMADPKLDLYNGSTKLTTNDNWGGSTTLSSAFQSVGAFAYSSTASLDAALVTSIDGGRTVQVSGPTEGTVLVEGYDAGSGDAQRFTNLSARNKVGTGSNILIAGFTLSGSGTRNLLIRAVGPKLSDFGVSGVLTDPKLEIYSGSSKLTENDNWASSLATTFSSVGAFALTAGSKDAAITVSLPAGGYTIQVSGADGGIGEAIVEIYELP